MRIGTKLSLVVAAILSFAPAAPAAPLQSGRMDAALQAAAPTAAAPVMVAQSDTTPAPAEAADPAKLAPRREDGDLIMGAADAPVTIIEYASLTCPHCAAFHTGTLPKLKETYVKTGQVKLIYRDFPLDRVALAAAMIVRCVDPARSFAFLDVFFQQQSSWAAGGDPNQMIAALKRLSRIGGVSEAQFDACLKDKSVEDAVLQQRLTGEQKFQVNSTPTLIINGKKFSGALSFEEVEKMIKPLLGRS